MRDQRPPSFSRQMARLALGSAFIWVFLGIIGGEELRPVAYMGGMVAMLAAVVSLVALVVSRLRH